MHWQDTVLMVKEEHGMNSTVMLSSAFGSAL